jgi:CHAT domain-containing protein
VGADELIRTVRTFRRFVQNRTTRRYLPPAWQLYDWLIRPLEAALQDVNIDTLVFVPDGPLRTIPMAALHDREQFLIEKYAAGNLPRIDAHRAPALPRENAQLLVAGLTEAVQGFPPLPHVAQEIAAMENLYANHQSLVNEGYLKTRFQERLREEPYTIVHIASHGEFNSRAKDTFILTYDGKLTLDQLDQMIGLLRLRDEPIELLTLSACQTAVGDDRAALGLAGIAVKAGVRSALATLWYINDEASADLVNVFYHNLQKPSYSRATALQQAQLHLLHTQRYRHPAYWAPFLLINNWL